MATEFLPESLDFFNRIAANGGSVTNSSMTLADTFVRGLLEAGLWPKLLEVGLFIGNNLNAALVKLKYPNGGQGVLVNNNFVAGDYAETGANGGLLGNGTTKVLRTGTPQTAIGATGHVSFYLREDLSGIDDRGLLGAVELPQFFGIFKSSNATDLVNCFGGGVSATYQNVTKGFFCGVRSAPTDLNLFKNGVGLGTTTTAATVANTSNDFAVWAMNYGASCYKYLDKRGSFYSLGQTLNAPEALQFYNLVQALQAGLGRSV
jgi:hypothetical protein